MVARGYAVACPDFRPSSVAPFPVQLEDCKAAVRWLRASAVRYRLDPAHFGAAGVSSGGHLAALLGVTGSNHLFDSRAHMGESSSVQAACVFFGPIDLTRLYETSKETRTPQAAEVAQLLGGDPRVQLEQARLANPVTHLEADASPFLLVHGTEDTVVPTAQSRLFYDALVKTRVPVHLHLIHGAGHTGPAFVAPEINAMVDEFFSHWLKPVPRPFETVKAVITESTAGKN
jgi:acetyl esterase/lipase